MKLLIIGGTIFVGRHCVEVAKKKGHEVTLFFRGKHNPDLFPDVEKIIGDRTTDLNLLEGRKWDAVIDTCGYFPGVVKASAEALAHSVGLYCFVSSVSAYADASIPNQTEDAPLAVTDDPEATTVTGENYGGLKALCEKEVDDVYGERSLIIRPTLIVGPDDISDRFSYWPVRFARGGKVAVPNRPKQPVQYIDVRDMAEWMIDLIERGAGGAFTAAGPDESQTMGDFLHECHRTINPDAELVWIDESFLRDNKVSAWADLPMWLDSADNSDGMDQMDISKAIASGLKFRTLKHILLDTLAWTKTRQSDYVPRGGLTAEREAEVVRLWEER